MFFEARPKWNDVDPLTVKQAAALMENVDPDAVDFKGDKFSFNQGWLPHVDESTVEKINKHFHFLKTKLHIRLRPMWGSKSVRQAYIVQLLKEHDYRDKRFNPAPANKSKDKPTKKNGKTTLLTWAGLESYKEGIPYKPDEDAYEDYWVDKLKKLGVTKTQGRVYFMKTKCEINGKPPTNKEIGERLGCVDENVRKHYANARGKIGVRNKARDMKEKL